MLKDPFLYQLPKQKEPGSPLPHSLIQRQYLNTWGIEKWDKKNNIFQAF